MKFLSLFFVLLFTVSTFASYTPNTTRAPSIGKPVIYGALIESTGVVTEIGGANFINGNCPKSSTSNQIGTCTFVTNIWSAQPVCTFTCYGGVACSHEVNLINTTTFTYRTWQSGATSFSYGVVVLCFGPSGL